MVQVTKMEQSMDHIQRFWLGLCAMVDISDVSKICLFVACSQSVKLNFVQCISKHQMFYTKFSQQSWWWYDQNSIQLTFLQVFWCYWHNKQNDELKLLTKLAAIKLNTERDQIDHWEGITIFIFPIRLVNLLCS